MRLDTWCGSQSFPAKRMMLLRFRTFWRTCGSGPWSGTGAFDAAWVLEEVRERGAEAVIPLKRNRVEPRDHDREMYGWRHRVEKFFTKIKEFRAVATRYDKTDESFAAAICLAAGVIAAT